ncbi:DUF5666 domain-containing protein [Thalassotalea sp. ND16A]|uniref:DUF5666 domain-containing protein n=1 Tax=Thalassotalea sp. ND16A TaxID=1535422 RepID=UPI00051A2809|nr:DUF5666 domain-containing protein [Thalassotalea sp. ND16A]KGJ95692.1 hypothetical protein ND16A_1227 [Thalassotalea sp. ND16A]
MIIKIPRIIYPLFMLLFTVLIVSCNDSSSSSPEPPPEEPPTTTDITTVGEISGFGSVIVNGVEYETEASSISDDDDNSLSENDLSVGMIVTLSGSVNIDAPNTGTASSIEYSAELKGFIDEINLMDSYIAVHGQIILFNELTFFENTSPETLEMGDFVEVNGFFNDTEQLVATRIELDDEDNEISIKGFVNNLDTVAQTFSLSNLLINYAEAEFDDFTAADLADGQQVKVKGLLTNLTDDTLQVDKVKLITHNDEPDSHAEIKGLITDFVSATEFMVNGINVTTNSQTEIENGDSTQLGNNVNVEVEGQFNDDNVLVASEVEIEDDLEVEVDGVIEAIDATNNTIVVLGVTFSVTDLTRMDDKSDADERFFNFSQLSVGDFVEVKGFSNADGDNIATRIVREDEDDDNGEDDLDRITGLVSDIDSELFTFSVAGIPVATTATTEFEIADDVDASRDEFFAQLVDGMVIKVKGNFDNEDNEVFVAVEVELEDEGLEQHNRPELTGPVTSIDIESLSFVIFGKTINTNAMTEFRPLDGDDLSQASFFEVLQIGDMLEVKGQMQLDDFIARRAEFEDDLRQEIEGIAENIGDDSFTVVGINIDISSASEFELENGLAVSKAEFLAALAMSTGRVEVRGEFVEGAEGVEGVFVATKVELEIQDDDDNDDQLELTGLVSAINSELFTFTLTDTEVATTETTRFETAEDVSVSREDFFAQLSDGMELEVKGNFEGEVFIADEVEIETMTP